MSALLTLALASAIVAAQSNPSSGRIVGQILEDVTRAPIVDARIMLMGGVRPGTPAPPREAVTDEAGRFVFDNVAPGTYRLQVHKAGFAATTPPPGQTVEVLAGAAAAVPVILLQRGGAIAGRVLDAAGEPLVDAHVIAVRRSPDQRMLMTGGSGGQTNDLGEFRLFGLAPGEYYVQAAPRLQSPFARGEAVQQRPTTFAITYYPGVPDIASAQTVPVAANQTSGDVVFRMITAPAYQVSGVVTDEAGSPVENAMVMLMPVRPGGAAPRIMGPPAGARTDSRGAFVFTNITAGEYTINASVPVTTAASNMPASGAVGVGASTWSTAVGPGGGGGATMVESRNGAVTSYRLDQRQETRVTVANQSVVDVHVVVQRPPK